MPLSYLVSYALVVGLAVTALVLLFRCGLWIGARGASSPTPPGRTSGARGTSVATDPGTAPTTDPGAGEATDPAARTFRRCEGCQLRWRAAERDRASSVVLRTARTWRRLRRTLTGAASTRLPASWDRCPRCLSRQVRASRARVRP